MTASWITGCPAMQRYTISLDDELAARFETWAQEHGYDNRSEAIRDLVRDRLGREGLDLDPRASCAATVSYVYDHHERDLGQRLIRHQHGHHGLTVSTMHVHLDESQCLEVAVLRGNNREVVARARELVAERGVQHGGVHVVPLAMPVGRFVRRA